jgi:pimeloyl-ACP methyl ester carboxylesterase
VYRETFKNIEDCKRWSQSKLKMPVIAIGSEYFVGVESKREMELVAENVSYVEIDCGHSLALERPQKLADTLDKFFSS